jgi:hypothetical protein
MIANLGLLRADRNRSKAAFGCLVRVAATRRRHHNGLSDAERDGFIVDQSLAPHASPAGLAFLRAGRVGPFDYFDNSRPVCSRGFSLTCTATRLAVGRKYNSCAKWCSASTKALLEQKFPLRVVIELREGCGPQGAAMTTLQAIC